MASSTDDGLRSGKADDVSLSSDLTSTEVRGRLNEMLQSKTRIGPDTLFGSTPTLDGTCSDANFLLSVRYVGPGGQRARSTWSTSVVGTVADRENGSVVNARFNRDRQTFLWAFMAAYLVVLGLISTVLVVVVLSGAKAAGPVILAPITLIGLWIAPLVVRAYGRRQALQDRQYLLHAIEVAARGDLSETRIIG